MRNRPGGFYVFLFTDADMPNQTFIVLFCCITGFVNAHTIHSHTYTLKLALWPLKKSIYITYIYTLNNRIRITFCCFAARVLSISKEVRRYRDPAVNQQRPPHRCEVSPPELWAGVCRGLTSIHQHFIKTQIAFLSDILLSASVTSLTSCLLNSVGSACCWEQFSAVTVEPLSAFYWGKKRCCKRVHYPPGNLLGRNGFWIG